MTCSKKNYKLIPVLEKLCISWRTKATKNSGLTNLIPHITNGYKNKQCIEITEYANNQSTNATLHANFNKVNKGTILIENYYMCG